ncbi:hypothetical protein A3F29_04890 [Candidatus Roizmanbacteria bacterium RIFCSPHIGHO2_12_FULL_33_9]|uniref:Uncharacterized protein n=1 Tax=Candidatus Roizmanbacteria bacterium RIFCSPHIGHO2_12_FULL_33_9 TaxID=1802045 RepID=A0A1F7HGI6_9BACT|nr:MAG: hypothetical protein A3F29_04890 [Candidatus Roizmanbacteria bacterium RIFCSPHIGHO2_12_FULL_33_9]
MDFYGFIVGGGSTEFLIKTVSLVFSFLFFIYTLIVYRQTIIMIKTLTVSREKIISFISFLQVIIALLLILMSLFLI